MTALVVKKKLAVKIYCYLFSLWLLSLFTFQWLLVLLTLNCGLWSTSLIDVTKMLALNGTMQYKVHKRYLKWMDGKEPYELGIWTGQVRQKFVFMTVKNTF